MTDREMTGREICERWARFQLGPGASQEDVEAAAKAFWESCSTGELWHVYAAAEVLRQEGLL